MKKKILVVTLVLCLLMGFSVTAWAVEPRASAYLDCYDIDLYSGTDSGELDLEYMILSTKVGLTEIGISKIQLYKTDGTLYRTIYDTIYNGLMRTSGYSHGGNYTITCEPGTAYYAVVTVTAGDAYGSDSRNVVTDTVVSPP